MTIDTKREFLKTALRGRIDVVSASTGIPASQLRRLIEGTANLDSATENKLREYFARNIPGSGVAVDTTDGTYYQTR